MYYNKIDTDKILEHNNRLVDVIGDFVQLTKKSESKYVGQCPGCSSPKGLEINTAKCIYKCFRCDVGGNSAVTFLMKSENKTYIQALEHINRKFSVVAEVDEKPTKKLPKKIAEKKSSTYCARMLEESGLTAMDVEAPIISITENKTTTAKPIFSSGTIAPNGEVDPNGDDMVIEYYDIEGNPCMYDEIIKKKPTGKRKVFFRVRFQFPEEHCDKDGKPAKYKSPYGSGTFLYIPQKIREMYRKGEKLKCLFLQEGEKKAEKACKHGVMSVGLSGIHNIAQKGKLPEDLIKIIQKLEVEEVVLLFDADWNDLSHHIKTSDSVEQRPRTFFYAAKNFKEYMYTLKIRKIYVEIYIGHVKPNTNDVKGIDDLLVKTLKASPDDIQSDIETLMCEKNLEGTYLRLFKITTWPDSKLEELWCLNNVQSFSKLHREVLQGFPEFKIGKYVWRLTEKGEIESAQPIEYDEQFWEETLKKTGENYKTVYEFVYENNLVFLQNRGFGRYRSIDGTVKFCHIQHPTISLVTHNDVRDYVKDFIRKIGKKGVLEMLHRGGPQYLGPDKLSDLNYIEPVFETPDRVKHRFYFNSFVWEINAMGTKQIDYTEITYNIWEESKQTFEPKLKEPLINVSLTDEKWDYTLSNEAKHCQFLQFMINASNFTWRKEKQLAEGQKDVSIDTIEIEENNIHLISKLAALGYLLLSSKDKSVPRAVVAMDGKQSEIGESNGRTGKSLIGDALTQVIPTLYISGKTKDIDGDTFLWTEMTDKTKLVFIDDVRVNFNIEFLFPCITGDWKVNYKGGGRATIPFAQSPKIYIPTNHALNGQGSSFTARQWIIAFSDFYNDLHQPKDDFGGLFFDDWDYIQWNLFWNFLSNCIQIYLKFGVVQAPGDRVEIRQYRQQMGETFLSWADEYFSDTEKLDKRLIRKTLYDEYLKYSQLQPKFISPTNFKNKVKTFCTWKSYKFNAHLYDDMSGKPLKYDNDGRPELDDKSGGVEYFYIGTKPITDVDRAVVEDEVRKPKEGLPF